MMLGYLTHVPTRDQVPEGKIVVHSHVRPNKGCQDSRSACVGSVRGRTILPTAMSPAVAVGHRTLACTIAWTAGDHERVAAAASSLFACFSKLSGTLSVDRGLPKRLHCQILAFQNWGFSWQCWATRACPPAVRTWRSSTRR
jgi:hypothetical protein